jgi:two-component system, NtrC family, sensor kinase
MSIKSQRNDIEYLRNRVALLEKALASALIPVKNSVRQQQQNTELLHKLSFLTERNPLAIITWNKEFEVVEWNIAAENIFGYSKKEALGRHASLIVPENYKIHVSQMMASLLEQEGGSQSTNENLTKDGRIITCTWHNMPLTNVYGSVVGIISIVEDITVRRAMEVALRKSEARYKKLVANVPGMIYQYRMELNGTASFPYLSDGCREIFGIEPEDAVNNPALILEAVYPDDQKLFIESIMVSVHTLQKWNWEGRMFSSNGQIKWIKAVSRPELQVDGAIVWDGLLIDVTDQKMVDFALKQAKIDLERRVIERTTYLEQEILERKQTEAALSKSEEKFRSFVENAVDLIYSHDVKGVFSYLSPNFFDILGYQPEEYLGKSFEPLVHPDDLKSCFRFLNQIIETNKKQEGLEFRTKRKDNTWCWMVVNTSPVRDDDGNVIGFQGIARDITERKQTDRELLRISKAVESVADAIGIADTDGLPIYLNPAFIELFGYTLDELKAAGGPHVLFADSVEAENIFTNVYNYGLSHRCEITMKNRNGKLLQLEITADAIKDKAGNIIGSIGLHRDISERKQVESKLKRQAEELEQAFKELQNTQSHLIQTEKMSSLGQLVAGVAHEINNPANFIHGNLKHAEEYTQDLLSLLHLYQINYPNIVPQIQDKINAIDLEFILEDLPGLFASMQCGTNRIRDIVASLRTFSRLDEADLKKADIHEGLDSTLMILEHRLRTTQQRPAIKLVKEYGHLPLVECYAGQLNQVFINILVNAIDSLDESVSSEHFVLNNTIPTICIRTEMPTLDTVLISIYDNGVGISEEVLQKLFDPFYTTKPVGKGTGMGLAISYQIITDRHRGALSCTSSLGMGAEFAIEIPIQQSNII